LFTRAVYNRSRLHDFGTAKKHAIRLKARKNFLNRGIALAEEESRLRFALETSQPFAACDRPRCVQLASVVVETISIQPLKGLLTIQGNAQQVELELDEDVANSICLQLDRFSTQVSQKSDG
jgi:hypothetical protein